MPPLRLQRIHPRKAAMTHPPDYEPDDTEAQYIAEVFAAAALEGPLFEPSAVERRPWGPLEAVDADT
jgi:hypothetical protein